MKDVSKVSVALRSDVSLLCNCALAMFFLRFLSSWAVASYRRLNQSSMFPRNGYEQMATPTWLGGDSGFVIRSLRCCICARSICVACVSLRPYGLGVAQPAGAHVFALKYGTSVSSDGPGSPAHI
jgi:hypothetical protein